MSGGFGRQRDEREIAEAEQAQRAEINPDRRVKKLRLRVGVEGVPAKKAIDPEREMSGGELPKSDSSNDEELLREVAVRKDHTVGGRREEAPEKEKPQAEQNEQVRGDRSGAKPAVERSHCRVCSLLTLMRLRER